jgi:hypothetical protein
MFRPTDRQLRLDGPAATLAESSRARLRASWAEPFRSKVMPLLLGSEAEFADAYHATTGRPNWSVARLLGILVMQEFRGLGDQEALDELAFDARWQYALDLPADDAYLSRRSLVDFRSRLVELDPEMAKLRRVFLAVTAAALAELKVSFAEQRLDSTHVISNIRTRGRVDLFGKTLRHFLRELKRQWPQHWERVSAALRTWFEGPEDGWFGAGKRDDERYRKRLEELARFLHAVVTEFGADADIVASESYALVARVLREHCEITPPADPSGSTGATGGDAPTGHDATSGPAAAAGTGGVQLRKHLENVGSQLQSPFDPDATYGHKGVGYSLHLVETCRNTSGTELLTDYEVVPTAPDQDQALGVVQRLKAHGVQPEVLYADAGYGSGLSIDAVATAGTELVAPVPRNKVAPDSIRRDRFSFDNNGRVTACPAGHAPLRHGLRRAEVAAGSRSLYAYFDSATCRACPLGQRCVVRGPDNGTSGSFNLELAPRQRVRDERLAEQDTPAFRERYAIRAGIEATNSELKRVHRIDRLRVRRLPRVRMAVALKVTACNVKRWLRAAATAAAAALLGALQALWVLFCATRRSAACLPAR